MVFSVHRVLMTANIRYTSKATTRSTTLPCTFNQTHTIILHARLGVAPDWQQRDTQAGAHVGVYICLPLTDLELQR